MARRLDSLANEILTDIAELLDFSHPSSLVAFAQTSERHYAIASRFLFRTIKITLDGREQLLGEVQKWESKLLSNNAFACVRRLILYHQGSGEPLLPPHHPYLALEQSLKSSTAPRKISLEEEAYYHWSCSE